MTSHRNSGGTRFTGPCIAVALCACGPSTAGGGGGPTPAPLVVDQGGPLLTAPKIVTITFPGDALAAQLQSFGQTVASSAWWDTVRAGYCEGSGQPCVGDGPPGTFVEAPNPAAPSYTDSAHGGASSLQQWLTAAIAAGSLPAPDTTSPSNTLYVAYFPATTTINYDGVNSCVNNAFDGYHGSLTLGTQAIAYAVIVECSPEPSPVGTVPTPSLLESVTLTASHEIVEAATDPVIASPAYGLDPFNTSNWGWIDIEGDEVADLCVDPFGLRQDETAEGAFTVQRIWSNAQASSRADPCKPVPNGEVYFNATPRQSFFILEVGASTTFEVDAFSDGAMSDWTLSAEDWSNSLTPAYLAFSIAGAIETDAGPSLQVHNGSTAYVTVTLLQDPGGLTTGEADGALVSISNPGSPLAAHWWPFAVMSSADAADAGFGHARRRPVPRFHRRRGSRSVRLRL